MSEINDGGPAFPEVPGDYNGYEGRAGMTLRDWFATHSPELASINVKADREKLAGIPEPSADDIEAMMHFCCLVEARLRYIYADAMLETRK